MSRMIIANRLDDGLVVFRAADGSWVESIAAGRLIRDPDEAASALESSRRDEIDNIVVGPELIAVTERGNVRTPDRGREAIRAGGPTIDVET